MTQNQGLEPKKNSGGYLQAIVEGMLSGFMAACLYLVVMPLILELIQSLNSTKFGHLEEPLQSFQLKAKTSGSQLATLLESSLKDMEPGTLVYLWLMSSPTSSGSNDSEISSNGSHETDAKETADLLQDRSDPEKYPWK